MNNDLTIAIPVYNEERLIEQAIRRTAPQCEQLIVSDNASTDGTSEICKQLQQEFPNLRYVRQLENIGSIRNCTSLLELIKTPYIMYMGSHDLIDKDYVNTVLPAITTDDSIAVVTGELCLEYETRSEKSDAYNNWTGGLARDSGSRVISFLFSRAPLEWASYGIFRTETIRRHFTDDLPRYGIDVIFLAHVLEEGRMVIQSGSCYHASVREKKAPPAEYIKRMTAKDHTSRHVKELHNNFRVSQFKLIDRLSQQTGIWGKVILRHQAMVRFGTFRIPGPDPLYFLLYLPVKIARKYERASRSRYQAK